MCAELVGALMKPAHDKGLPMIMQAGGSAVRTHTHIPLSLSRSKSSHGLELFTYWIRGRNVHVKINQSTQNSSKLHVQVCMRVQILA